MKPHEAWLRKVEDAESLTPFGTSFRAPDIIFEPEATEVSGAIEQARHILMFVRKKMISVV